MEARNEAITQLSDVIDDVRRLHPNMRLDTVQDLIKHGEPTVAVEILCDNLFETRRFLPKDTYEKLTRVGRFLKVDPKTWEGLEDEGCKPE